MESDDIDNKAYDFLGEEKMQSAWFVRWEK